MSLNSKSSKYKSKTLSQFDRGTVQILQHFPILTRQEVISIQLLFFTLLEVLSLNLTDNDPTKSRLLSQLLLHFLQSSKMLPVSMSSAAKSIRQLDLFQNYVRIIQGSIQTALNLLQKSSSSNGSTIISLLEKDYTKLLLSTQSPSNISIDIPQADIQLRVPLPLTMNGTIMTNDFDNIVVFRYVQDFYEDIKLGKGAFGSVFRAKNRLDARMYAIKKIVFNENTDQTRRQAKRALREVRVLASLSHPNIVQYHCAWLELVPVQTYTPPRASSSQMKETLPKVEQVDSLDELIEFEGQSSLSVENKKDKDEIQSKQKSLTTSTSQEDESEVSSFATNGNHSDSKIRHEYHSDGKASSSKITFHHSTSYDETAANEKLSNKQLIPLHSRTQTFHPAVQSNIINSKIVLFIQMQLCDTTLHDWLRYRNHTIIKEPSTENRNLFYTLSDIGQRECWHIFKQLLTAVQYLHSQSFVHRDIKPRNIFLAYDSKDPSSVHVKLGDFGLATLLDSASTINSSEQFPNDDSAGVGTVLYAPPEQLNSNPCIVTTKSDSYSLGIVLFELFHIFSTEMERLNCFSDLRIHMKVGEQFARYYPFETNIIEQLVLNESDKRLNVEELLTKYAREIHQKVKNGRTNSKQMIIEQLQEKLRDQDKRIQQLELELEKNKL